MNHLMTMALLLWSMTALAEGTEYVLRVDGLACPYCAYGIEKKLRQIEGVEHIDIDLDRGLVTVDMAEGRELTEPQMTRLFEDAGFTFRSMTSHPK
jgi:mercuric ion binding protein